ncbi:MAG: carboxypeptidase regulatory-like domain-containing protein, partial [Acidobacteria bacterium]|nr:carboxypeptidase regulatory-like domain-containing protein [Acidobacteriota bacterium]
MRQTMTQYSSKLMILVLALAVLASPVAFAQITGEIRGVVLDPSGAAIPNAKITLTSKETGATRQVTSDEEGRFALPLLPIGEYEVKAEAPAFRIAVTPAIVRSGEISTVRFALEVGQVTESVVVTDAVSALDTENAQVQYSIEGEKIQEFPVGRNPNLFATIAPGVIPVTEANPFLGSGSYNSNGSRGRANNITVDNVTSTDISVTGTGGPLSPLNFSQIKEVKLITNNFTAEYGRNSGS